MNTHKEIYASVLSLVLVCALPGCESGRKCGFEGCPGDSELTNSVQRNINQHAEFGAPDSIRVMTVDHVVYLNGQVDGVLQKRSAAFVAKQVPGVTKVVNNLDVSN